MPLGQAVEITVTPARSALSLSELSPTPTTIKVRSEQSRVRETSLRRVLDSTLLGGWARY
jgi:hypothetical protein